MGRDCHVFHVWTDLAVHVGPAFPADLHRHFAVQVLLSFDGPFLLRSSARDAWGSHAAAVVPSNVWHELAAPPARLAMIYVDPLSPVGVGLLCATGGGRGVAPLPPELAAPMAARLREADDRSRSIREAIEGVLARRGGVDSMPLDRRIGRALETLRSQPVRPPSLPEMAAIVRLSPARFRHLFRQETGVAFSGYRLWNRVLHATRLLATSRDLTRAAHAAGFADSAHFSRTFRRAFGLTPSEIFKSGRFCLVLCD